MLQSICDNALRGLRTAAQLSCDLGKHRRAVSQPRDAVCLRETGLILYLLDLDITSFEI